MKNSLLTLCLLAASSLSCKKNSTSDEGGGGGGEAAAESTQTPEPTPAPSGEASSGAITILCNGSTATWSDALFEDFTGDGNVDMMAREPSGNWWISRSKGGELYDVTLAANWSNTVNWRFISTGDLNGDGKKDLFGVQSGTAVGAMGGGWWKSLGGPTSFVTSIAGIWDANLTFAYVGVGDTTGERKDDILGVEATTGNIHVITNSASVSDKNIVHTGFAATSDLTDFGVIDYDGDGKRDIIARNKSTSQWTLLTATGSGFTQSVLGTWP